MFLIISSPLNRDISHEVKSTNGKLYKVSSTTKHFAEKSGSVAEIPSLSAQSRTGFKQLRAIHPLFIPFSLPPELNMLARTPTLRLLSKKANYMFIYLRSSICPTAFLCFSRLLRLLQLSLEIPNIPSELRVSNCSVYLFTCGLVIQRDGVVKTVTRGRKTFTLDCFEFVHLHSY